MAWIGKCVKDAVEGSDYCSDHNGLKCASCGATATRTCRETQGSLCCGENLCSDCEHRIGPDGTNYGSKHIKRDQQEYRSWLERKEVKGEVEVLCNAEDIVLELISLLGIADLGGKLKPIDKIYLKHFRDLITAINRPSNPYWNTHNKLNAALRELDSFSQYDSPEFADLHLENTFQRIREFFKDFKTRIVYYKDADELTADLDQKPVTPQVI
jgi:hypothetical protein